MKHVCANVPAQKATRRKYDFIEYVATSRPRAMYLLCNHIFDSVLCKSCTSGSIALLLPSENVRWPRSESWGKFGARSKRRRKDTPDLVSCSLALGRLWIP